MGLCNGFDVWGIICECMGVVCLFCACNKFCILLVLSSEASLSLNLGVNDCNRVLSIVSPMNFSRVALLLM